jgi:hypothetical protein
MEAGISQLVSEKSLDRCGSCLGETEVDNAARNHGERIAVWIPSDLPHVRANFMLRLGVYWKKRVIPVTKPE